MTQITDTKEISKHQWLGTFLNNRFKVNVTSDAYGKNLYWEWDPVLPWESRMSPRTKNKFYAELKAFREIVVRDCVRISNQNIVLVELGGAA